MELLRRKIDRDLASWKSNPDRLPLIIKGARLLPGARGDPALLR